MNFFSTMPKTVRERLLARARSGRVAFPESSDQRVQDAVRLLRDGAGVQCELITEDRTVGLIQQTTDVIACRSALRGKTVNAETLTTLSRDPFYTAGAMLERGEVDAVVGGAQATTAHVIRAALATVGVESATPLVTSCFLFQLREPTAAGEDIVLYADAAVLPQPSADQLVQLAFLASRAFAEWTGRDPRVGFLSFSTHGSAEHADVTKVRQAAQAFADLHSNILSEGELQFDAATVPEIARRKNPATRLAGRTNVFIFPDLDAANIAYKVTQRLAGAEAWGPLLLGTAKPYSDLSRGASAIDIAHVALLTLALRGNL